MLQLASKASDVRQNFSEFIDTVIRDHPGFVTRNRDTLAAMSIEQLSLLLEGVSLHAELEVDENDEFIGTVAEIEDIVVCGKTREDALRQLAKCLTEYAEDYLTDSFKLYFYAPNRRSHFPYVLKIALQNNVEDVVGLLNAWS